MSSVEGQNPDQSEKARLARRSALGQALLLGTNLAVGMGLFTLAGYYVDHRHGGEGHLWTVVGMLLGFTYGGFELWNTIRALNATDVEAGKGKDGRHGR